MAKLSAKKALSDNQKVVLSLLALFIVVQGLGLYLGAKAIAMLGMPVETEAAVGVGMFAYILVATAVILAVIKFWRGGLRWFELFAVFFSSFLFFQLLLLGIVPDSMAFGGFAAIDVITLVLAGAITLSRVFWKNLLTQDVAMLCSIIGVGALLGASLGFLPAIILLGLLTVYDVIAVFKTKHMVTMAKEIVRQRLAFTLAIPTKKHLFQLGGGDLVMPLVFSVAVLREFGMAFALCTAIGAMVSLIAFFAWLVDRPGKAYPALPPVTMGAIAGWAIAVIGWALI